MQLHFEDRAAWRSWLAANHEAAREVWLIFFKKHTGIPTISYDAAVEEALCFGWIDSIIKRLDEQRYARKFTPRTNTSHWSRLNLERVQKLKAAGRMTAAGLAKIDPATRPVDPPSARPLELPADFREALAKHAAARRAFEQLPPSHKRRYILWVDSAKREETRHRRLAEALTLLASKKPLGMR